MIFPALVQHLVGQCVLLIGVDRDDPRRAYFVSGVATWNEPQLQVAAPAHGATLTLHGTVHGLRGFDPDMLPRVLTREAWGLVAPIAKGSVAAVVGFAASRTGGIAVTDAFLGLAMNAGTDEIFLMQGDDDE